MSYLVYVEYNAENHQFFLWYREYVRRFEALPEKEKVLSPEWFQTAPKSQTCQREQKGKGKQEGQNGSCATMMEIGYNIKDGALFGDEQDVSLGSHVSVDMKNEKAVAPSILETIINLSASPQTVLKWQPCV
jgi:hypothetical protein